MGYTHYWTVKDMQAVASALPLVAHDLKRLLPKLPPLAGPDGMGKPILGPRVVEFNGVAPNDYETFWLDTDPKDYLETERGLFNCCKTQHRPYDLAVQVALVLLKYHSEFFEAGAVSLNSDGNLLAWIEACRLVETLGHPVDPMWALEREVWQVKGKGGAVFYIEWPRQSNKDRDDSLDWKSKASRESRIYHARRLRPSPENLDSVSAGERNASGSALVGRMSQVFVGSFTPRTTRWNPLLQVSRCMGNDVPKGILPHIRYPPCYVHLKCTPVRPLGVTG